MNIKGNNAIIIYYLGVAGSRLARICELALSWCASKIWVLCRDLVKCKRTHN